MGASVTNVTPAIREHYHKNHVDIFNIGDDGMTPLLAALEQRAMDDSYGRGYMVPVTSALPTAVSHTFATAQAKAQGSTVGSTGLRDRWNVTPITLEGTAYIDRAAIDRARDDDDLFDVIERSISDETLAMRKRVAVELAGKGWGDTGGTISGITSTTITLPTWAVNRIDIGTDLVAAATQAASTLRSATVSRVTGINSTTGVVTLSVDPTSLSWANGDTVFFAGDRENSATPTRLALTGFDEWLPTSQPSTTLFGIDRTGSEAYGGRRYDASTNSDDHATAFIKGLNHLFKHGGTKADTCFTSVEDYAVLCADKENTKVVQIPIEIGKYKIGFDAVTVQTMAGNIPVVADPWIPQGTAWAGPFKDKRYAPFIAYTGDLIQIDDKDGLQMLRASSATSYEIRLYGTMQLACPAPGKFLRIFSLPST